MISLLCLHSNYSWYHYCMWSIDHKMGRWIEWSRPYKEIRYIIFTRKNKWPVFKTWILSSRMVSKGVGVCWEREDPRSQPFRKKESNKIVRDEQQDANWLWTRCSIESAIGDDFIEGIQRLRNILYGRRGLMINHLLIVGKGIHLDIWQQSYWLHLSPSYLDPMS